MCAYLRKSFVLCLILTLLLIYLLVYLKQLLLQVLLLALVQVVHLVACVLRIVLNLLARLECILVGLEYRLHLAVLLLDGLLPVTDDPVLPLLPLSLPQVDVIDRVDGKRQEQQPWHMHIQDFFESAGVPNVH